jgi:hypothetical protein
VTDGCVKLGEDIICDSCRICEADGVIESVDTVASGGAVAGIGCDIEGVWGTVPFC